MRRGGEQIAETGFLVQVRAFFNEQLHHFQIALDRSGGDVLREFLRRVRQATIVQQVAKAKALDIVDSARLFALTSMAGIDAYIAVFDAKFAYNFWRPVTAIRRTTKRRS